MEQQRQGTGMHDLPVLTVPGRRSGEPRRAPLTVLELDGERYVLGGFLDADRVKNVRAATTATLGDGRSVEEVRLVELDAEAARPILRAWPAATSLGVEMMRDAGIIPDTTPDAMETAAGICPVFRVERME